MPADLYPIETDRLILRQVNDGDVDAIHAYQRLPEVARFCMWEPRSRAEVVERMPGWIARNGQGDECEGLVYAMTVKDTGAVFGDCGLVFTDREARQAELGYVIHSDFQRQGYTSEAARALVEIGFEKLNLHRIFARCDARNIGSWKVMEKLGMRREAEFREHAIFKGEWDHEFVYAILEDEWREKQGN